MHKYGESKMTQIVMSTVHHMTSNLGVRKFQATWLLLDREYILQRPSEGSIVKFNLVLGKSF